MGISAQDEQTTFHSSSEFLGFASEIAFLISPHKFSMGLRSGDWAGHSITSIFFVWNQDVARLLVCLGSLSCWNAHFGGISSSAYGNISSSSILMHSNWPMVNAMNGPNTVVWKSSPYHDFCATMLHRLHSGLWLELPGSRLTFCPRPLDPKRTILLICPQNAISLWADRCVSWQNFDPLCTSRFFQQWCFTGASCWWLRSNICNGTCR